MEYSCLLQWLLFFDCVFFKGTESCCRSVLISLGERSFTETFICRYHGGGEGGAVVGQTMFFMLMEEPIPFAYHEC